MALSIGVSVGSKIDVSGRVLQVKAITQPNLIVISMDGGPDILVTDKDRKEILPVTFNTEGKEVTPAVYVFVGIGPGGASNRLAFEAPRSIRISRIEPGRR